MPSGLDAAFARLVERAQSNSTAALAVATRQGEVREWWDDAGPRMADWMSVTKFLVVVGLGFAIEAGDIDRPLAHWIEEWADDARGAITLRRLLVHCSGLEVRPSSDVYAEEDANAFALSLALGESRGYAYNNAAFQLVDEVALRASGQHVDQLLARHVLEPLSANWEWQRDNAGAPLCMAGAQMAPRDLARIGALVLDGGGGVIPTAWADAMPPPEGSELGLGSYAEYEWIDRSGEKVAVGPVCGFGHSGTTANTSRCNRTAASSSRGCARLTTMTRLARGQRLPATWLRRSVESPTPAGRRRSTSPRRWRRPKRWVTIRRARWPRPAPSTSTT